MQKGPYLVIHKVPLFREYTIEQLTQLTPYSAAYLEDLRRKPDRMGRMFKKHVAKWLGRTEAELFDETLPPEAQGC